MMDEDEIYEFIGLRAEDETAEAEKHRGSPAVTHAPIEDDNAKIVVTDVVPGRARPNKGDLLVQLMVKQVLAQQWRCWGLALAVSLRGGGVQTLNVLVAAGAYAADETH
ncbi:hypothetical protein E2562_033456 [Oryza meyeriana var. granulata]|uniref:Uncharacterized protein n=1 Tax=Oryza meyeriana var. granulata TaxID=110450 RepID=A0A6G1E6U7_9ORYZ|nr:hypothetical protein E2562_033456 [Oryza meyeriana var. granulata]